LFDLVGEQLRHLPELDVLAFPIPEGVDKYAAVVADVASESAVDDVLQRLQGLTTVTREQLGLFALEVQTRTVCRVFTGHRSVNAERTGDAFQKIDDWLRRIAH